MSGKSILYKDFHKICRFCVQETELVPVSECSELYIFEAITGLPVQQIDLPEGICSDCVAVFYNFELFINNCKNNFKNLKTVYLDYTLKKCDSDDNVINDDIDIAENKIEYDSDEDSKPLAVIRDSCKDSQTAIDKLNSDNVKKKRINSPPKTRTTIPKELKSKPTKCTSCEFETTYGELKKHYKLSSKCMPKNFKCTECSKAFNRRHKLTAHMRSHTKEAPFQCTLCFKTFRFAQNLRRHNLVHKGLKPFKCDVCSKEFSRQHVLNEHKNIHTGHNPYICTYCGKGFKRYANHYIHVYRHKLINGEIDRKADDAKSYLQLECEICNKIFASRSGLMNHISLHQEEPRPKKFLCNECGKGFMTVAQLESHSRIHTGDKPFVCTVCDKRFRQRSAYSNHQLLHAGIKPHKCTVCERLFTQAGHLKIHMRTHSGEKPFSCTFCDKKFALKNNLKVHTRIHTGETPYVCSVCEKGFYDSSSLKKHKKGHGISISSY